MPDNLSSTRDRIMARIRAATAEAPNREFAAVLASRPPAENLLAPVDDPVNEFLKRARSNGCELIDLPDLPELPVSVASRLPGIETLAADERLGYLDWSAFRLTDNTSEAATGLVLADAGIAETGTLVFTNRTVASSLLFLVDHLAVLLLLSRLQRRQEDTCRAIDRDASAVHLVSGPSRTADVEQTIQIGAHGPRRLLVFVLDDRASPVSFVQ
ncbi:hypothetical protein FV139_18625 [Parahaliea maris]|uniref:LUD domain-containing protein n=1 Tax=Parahaliea maris TaxID=2716870 RepID=A0A5C8ZRR9_9GAMM|nr:LUD domain-containing protein [Parahaliea maris]TXS90272.1 hypothetical protein FV139_18625 [Parahaliea maris]